MGGLPGDWVCWQNSDDIFYLDSFEAISRVINEYPKMDFIIGDINLIDSNDLILKPQRYVKPTYHSILSEGMILTNQAAFWKRELHLKIGFLDEDLDFAFDYDWFLRLLKNYKNVFHISKIIGALRYHEQTKTNLNQQIFNDEMVTVRMRHNQAIPPRAFYLARRLLFLILNGNIKYILRGVYKRASGVEKINELSP